MAASGRNHYKRTRAATSAPVSLCGSRPRRFRHAVPGLIHPASWYVVLSSRQHIHPYIRPPVLSTFDPRDSRCRRRSRRHGQSRATFGLWGLLRCRRLLDGYCPVLSIERHPRIQYRCGRPTNAFPWLVWRRRPSLIKVVAEVTVLVQITWPCRIRDFLIFSSPSFSRA